MKYLLFVLFLAAFSSFGWGMLGFFSKPGSRRWESDATGVLGFLFLLWHGWAVAVAPPSLWRDVAGILLYSASTCLFWMAVRAIRQCHRQPFSAIFQADPPLQLVRSGPYHYIRHPFYTAYTMAWTAGWIVSGQHLLLLSMATMFAIYWRASRMEEAKFDATVLGGAYSHYRKQTGAFFPKLFSRSLCGFSWAD